MTKDIVEYNFALFHQLLPLLRDNSRSGGDIRYNLATRPLIAVIALWRMRTSDTKTRKTDKREKAKQYDLLSEIGS